MQHHLSRSATFRHSMWIPKFTGWHHSNRRNQVKLVLPGGRFQHLSGFCNTVVSVQYCAVIVNSVFSSTYIKWIEALFCDTGPSTHDWLPSCHICSSFIPLHALHCVRCTRNVGVAAWSPDWPSQEVFVFRCAGSSQWKYGEGWAHLQTNPSVLWHA